MRTLRHDAKRRAAADAYRQGAVENSVGALKKFLRGRVFSSLSELSGAVAAWAQTSNERPNSLTHRRPNDLLVAERRGGLPEPYPIAHWSEHRVRADCHVQVRYNFYSVPYTLVGKRVVVRVDVSSVTVYDDLQVVARHQRQLGRGQTVTDRAHYPPHKQRSSHEIHRERLERVRAVGAGAAAFLHGLLQSRDHVHNDAFRALLHLIEVHDRLIVDRACARAAHFGNFSLDALRTILAKRLYELPLDDLTAPALGIAPRLAIVRPLDAYAQLFGGIVC